jgi:hypothetical protein
MSKLDMTQNGLGITSIARHCWSANLPVSYALQRCIELGFYRIHIKRFVETIYEQQDTDFNCWLDGFGRWS